VWAVNFIDVIWDAVISFMTHRNRHHQTEATTAETVVMKEETVVEEAVVVVETVRMPELVSVSSF